MSYQSRVDTAQHQGFRGRVKMAAVVTAVNVAAEAPSGDQRRDSLRSALATNLLNDPEGYTERCVWAVLTNATVANGGINAPDGDLEFVMSAVWDALAGV